MSVAGSAVTLVALPLLVLRLTGSALATSGVGAVEVVPYFAFGLLAGAVADRVDRRRPMVAVVRLSPSATSRPRPTGGRHVAIHRAEPVVVDAASPSRLPSARDKRARPWARRVSTSSGYQYVSATMTVLVSNGRRPGSSSPPRRKGELRPVDAASHC